MNTRTETSLGELSTVAVGAIVAGAVVGTGVVGGSDVVVMTTLLTDAAVCGELVVDLEAGVAVSVATAEVLDAVAGLPEPKPPTTTPIATNATPNADNATPITRSRNHDPPGAGRLI
ncbi:MAG: hypothetical protein ACXVX9_06045 [Mycobacteriaceae bacterium]